MGLDRVRPIRARPNHQSVEPVGNGVAKLPAPVSSLHGSSNRPAPVMSPNSLSVVANAGKLLCRLIHSVAWSKRFRATVSASPKISSKGIAPLQLPHYTGGPRGPYDARHLVLQPTKRPPDAAPA